MKILLVMAAALSLSGCAAVTLTKEVEDLKTSSDGFQASLKALGKGIDDGAEADQRATLHQAVAATGARVTLLQDCRKPTSDLADAYERILGANPYSSAASDAAFRQLHTITLCDFAGLSVNDPLAPADFPKLEPGTGTLTGSTVGADTLPGAAKAIGDYVEALSDLAGNTTGAAADKARANLFTAGGALLTATKVDNGASISEVVGQLVHAVVIAQRNKRIREYMDAYDALLPHIMERVGTAGRLAAAQSITNRTAASATLASDADRMLNDPALLGEASGSGAMALRARATRAALFQDYETRLSAENAVLRGLRGADPMAAARGFAKAHHEMAVAFRSPRATNEALVSGLKDFNDAATTLVEALAKED